MLTFCSLSELNTKHSIMKKLMILFAFALFTNPGKVAAQQGSSEISVKAGVGSIQEIGEAFGTALGTAIANGLGSTVSNTEIKATPALSASYEYYVTDGTSLGLSYTFQQFDNTYTFANATTSETKSIYHVPMASLTARYINNPSFQLYGNAAAGVYLTTESENGGSEESSETSFAFQFTPIGARFGKDFGVKVELGLGFQGLGMAGASGKF